MADLPDLPAGAGFPLVDATSGEFLSTAVNESLSATYGADADAMTAKFLAGPNVRSLGADGGGASDDAPAIQAAIDDLAAEFISSAMSSPAVLYFPAGKYRVNSTVTQPPYVKIVTLGMVIIESYVAAASPVWHITPLASDPTDIYGPVDKQQWNWGSIIDGSIGGMMFINRAGSRTGRIGMELGSRTDLGVYRPLSRYEMNGLMFQEYGLGVKWNTFNHYIATYRRWHMELCDTFFHYGSGVNVLNSGEKVSFIDCLFGVNTVGNAAHVIDCDTTNLQFFNCSHDYMSTLLHFTAAAGYQRVDFFGGHIENINEGSRYSVDGGIVRSDVVSPRIFPEVVLHGVPYVSTARGVQFRGNVIVRADMDYRQVQNGVVPYANAYLCDETVQPRNWRMRGFEQRVLSARKFNAIPDGSFKTEVDATAHGSLAKWTTDIQSGFSGTVVASGPRVADKSLQFTIGAAGYWRFYAKSRTRCQPGSRVTASFAYYLPAAPATSFQARMLFYDDELNLIETTANTTFTVVVGYAAWNVPSAPLGFYAPEGATSVRVQFSISAASATAGSISDIYVSVESP